MQHHSYRTPHGCITLVDIQTHQRLPQDSPIHFHPGLILQPFLQGRRYEQWLLTDNGTVPPCYLRSADRCSNFSEISQSTRCCDFMTTMALHDSCSVFQKLLILVICVINMRRRAHNARLLTQMTLNLTFKTTCRRLMAKIMLPLNLSPRKNHIKWYYMIWVCFRPLLTFVTLTSEQLKIIIFQLGTSDYHHIDTKTTKLTFIQPYLYCQLSFWINADGLCRRVASDPWRQP